MRFVRDRRVKSSGVFGRRSKGVAPRGCTKYKQWSE